MKELLAIDVCAGAGGWSVAARGLPIRVVAAFDRNARCLDTYALNHPHVACYLCDVRTFNFRPWRGIDLILGGIPCEQLSRARVKPPSDRELTELDELIDRCLSLPQELGARWWCYEDVVGLRRRLPPLTPYFELDSQDYCRQRRKRIYVGNVPKPPRGNNRMVLRSALRPGPYRVSATVLQRDPKTCNTYDRRWFYPWHPDAKAPTTAGLGCRHDNHQAVRCLYGAGWRQLEWQEAARLQGFPNDYVFVGNQSEAWKQIAQAVQINTARAILRTLCEKHE